jgi:type IX secretion system PorP/SprF family membrane protein
MKKNILYIIAGIIFSSQIYAQDIHFSFMEYSPLLVNPANAGNASDIQGIINYRTQYRAVAVPFNTFNASFDMKLSTKSEKGNWITGLNLFSDKSGDAEYTSNGFNLIWGYRHQFAKNHALAGAINLGYSQNRISYNELKWGNQYDGYVYNKEYSTGETALSDRLGFWDSGLGLVYSYKNEGAFLKNLNAGVAIYHLNTPKYQFIKTNSEQYLRRFSYFVNSKIDINTEYSLLPGVYYNTQGKSSSLYMGSYIRKSFNSENNTAFSLGLFGRTKDAITLKLMYEYQKYSAGVGYDINISGLNSASKYRGAFELFLRYNAPTFIVKSRPRI